MLLGAAGALGGFRIACLIGERRAGWACLLALPAVPCLTFASVSGTEVPLFVFLLMATGELALRERWELAGLSAGLAVLARPEGYILLPLLGCAALLEGARQARRVARSAWRAVAPALRAVAPAVGLQLPWIGYCLWATGRPMPSTYYAKTSWFGFIALEQLEKIGWFLSGQPFAGGAMGRPLIPALGAASGLILLAIGAWRLLRASRGGIVLVGGFVPLFFYAISIQHPLGLLGAPDDPGAVANFYFARYLIPGLPFLVLLWLLGLLSLDSWLAGRLGGRPSSGLPARLAIAAALIAIPASSIAIQHLELRAVYSWNCQNIERLQVEAGRWVAANVPAGATVAATDAGALRFFGERRTVDLFGLNTQRRIPVILDMKPRAGRSAEEAQAIIRRFWSEPEVDFWVLFTRWAGRLPQGAGLERIAGFRLKHNTIADSPELVVLRGRIGHGRFPGP